MTFERLFPVTCVDNFLDHPDELREYALSLEYSKQPGNYPGKRSNDLHKIDQKLYFFLSAKILSLFYPLSSRPSFVAKMQFQQIVPYDTPDELNSGWIHRDSGALLAGLIYLNKNPVQSSGTTIYDPLFVGDKNEKYKDFSESRNKLYNEKPVDIDLCIKQKREHQSQFRTSIEFKNIYNRMICYPGDYYHTASGFFCNDEPRLTLVFFFYELSKFNDGKDLPLARTQNFKI